MVNNLINWTIGSDDQSGLICNSGGGGSVFFGRPRPILDVAPWCKKLIENGHGDVCYGYPPVVCDEGDDDDDGGYDYAPAA
ncbi:unnamed protein product [Vicia faba]|uniref:Uncharacterized protein n=1 Tax=Vicia faba TaxID=3906 RepID=A0AAV0YPQ7_VICFA|nr:unnamed protein product [Vicia faba]